MGTFYVYCLFRPWNGEPCYIGKGKGQRIQEHSKLGVKHYNKHLASVFRRAGSTELPSVVLRSGLTEAEAFEYERAWIKALGRADKGLGPLCNWTDGGEGSSGKVTRQETKALISAKRIGQRPSRESVEQGRLKNLGSKRSAEGRANMKAAQQERRRFETEQGIVRSLSDETKAKMSATRKGKPKTAEHKAKIGAKSKGRKKSEATLAKARANGLLNVDIHRASAFRQHAAMTEEQKAERGRKISEATRRAMQSPEVRAKCGRRGKKAA